MKKITLIITGVLFTLNVLGQAPNWMWAKSAGGTATDWGWSVSTDASGNVFMTGYFYSPTITFGTITLTNANSAGTTSDIFIVKYDAAGNVLWAKSAGGISDDGGRGVSTDANGNVFMAGFFYSPSIIFGTTTLTNVGSSDIFIVKYNASGNVVWAKRAGGTSEDYGVGVSSDASGNVFMTGSFQSSTITFGTTTLTNVGNNDNFIVKYNTLGNVLWAKSAGGADNDEGISVSTDVSGNVFMTGNFSSPTITFGTTTLTNAGSQDIFIVKYSASGNALWAKSTGGTADDYGWSVSSDANGNVFMTGYFWSYTITFGTTTLTNAGSNDIFIVKFDASGNVLWAKSAGGYDDDGGISVSTDASGNVFMIGEFFSPTITFGTTTLTNAGGESIFIVKYDALGNVLWAKSVGGAFGNEAISVSTDASDNVFMTGYFNSPTITFGTTTLTNDTTGNTGDIFIAKLNGITGIEELDNSMSFTISPNPFTSFTTITFNEEQKNTTIKITDVLGNVIQQSTISNQKSLTIDMSGYAKGIYFVEVRTEQGIVNKKIIKN